MGTKSSSRFLALAGAILLAACTSPGGDGNRLLPDGPNLMPVTITDTGFELDGPVPEGRTVFTVRNESSDVHKVTLLPLPEDMPPLAVQLRGATRVPMRPFAGVPPREPGSDGMFAVDLDPGRRYGLVCFLHGPDGESYARNGMNAEFRTTETRGGAEDSVGDGEEL